MVPNAAQARDYPFCIVGADYDNAIGECTFDTYAQCQAAASGRFDFCQANPFYSDQKRRIAHPGKARAHYRR